MVVEADGAGSCGSCRFWFGPLLTARSPFPAGLCCLLMWWSLRVLEDVLILGHLRRLLSVSVRGFSG